MALLAPDATWPRHTNPEWRQTLRQARDHGWWLRTSGNHIFGTLQCRNAPKGQRCEQIVFKTGVSTENVARSTRQKIDRCPHASSEAAAEHVAEPMSLGQIEVCLQKADRLIQAAWACVREASYQHQCTELLGEAEVSLDRCDELLEQAAAAEQAAAIAAEAATRNLSAAGYEGPAAEPASLSVEAERLVDVAEQGLHDADPADEVTRLRARANYLRSTVAELMKFLRV